MLSTRSRHRKEELAIDIAKKPVNDRYVLDVIHYVFEAPIVQHPPNDGASIPKTIKEKIVPSRIRAVLEGDYEKQYCSIADLVAYLYSTSLKFPLPSEYVKIYIYYADKLFNGKLRKIAPDIVPDKLTSYEESVAAELRRKIFLVQIKHLKNSRRVK